MIAFEEDGLPDILIGAGNSTESTCTLMPREWSWTSAGPSPLPEIQLCVIDP